MRGALGLLAILIGSAAAQTAPVGRVLKKDADKAYFSLNRSSGVRPGQSFEIFTEGEMLRDPATGKPVGPIERSVASGRIVEVRENYSLGALVSGASAVRPGQKVRVSEQAPSGSADETTHGRAPYYRSPPLDIAAVDITVGDVDGDGTPEIVLASKNAVLAFRVRQEENVWRPVCSFHDDARTSRIVSVEAADLAHDGRSAIFVTAYDGLRRRIGSYVLTCRKGDFQKTAALPWMIRSITPAAAPVVLGAQQLVDDADAPLSDIHAVRYSAGAYTVSPEPLADRRQQWLYGYVRISDHGPVRTVSHDQDGTIRVELEKGSKTSDDAFGQTANLVRWGGRLLRFHPRVIVALGPGGFDGVYALSSAPDAGMLPGSWGLSRRAELHHLRWKDKNLEPDWSAALQGRAAGLAARVDGRGRTQDLLAAVVDKAGKTSVWFFELSPSSAR